MGVFFGVVVGVVVGVVGVVVVVVGGVAVGIAVVVEKMVVNRQRLPSHRPAFLPPAALSHLKVGPETIKSKLNNLFKPDSSSFWVSFAAF